MRTVDHWCTAWPPADGLDGEEVAAMIQPAMAYALWFSLQWLAELWDQAPAGDVGDETFDELGRELPRIARRWLEDEPFCRRMAASATWLGRQVWDGTAGDGVARCTADEVNLHLAIRKTDTVLDLDLGVVALLRQHSHAEARDQRSWASNATDVLFRDLDVEMLWMPSMDGIEDDDALLDALAVAPLRVAQWFEPFEDVEINPLEVPHPQEHRWRNT